MSMKRKSTTEKTQYDFIERNYRDPGGTDPVKRWLPHPENARVICAVLYLNGMPEQELQDGMQDVFVRALTAFKRGARVPADLREMKAFCAAIAKKYAMATYRLNARRARLGHAGICEADADEYTPLEYGAPERHDAVDTERHLDRQLEVLARLFRDGRMTVKLLIDTGVLGQICLRGTGTGVERGSTRLTMARLYAGDDRTHSRPFQTFSSGSPSKSSSSGTVNVFSHAGFGHRSRGSPWAHESSSRFSLPSSNHRAPGSSPSPDRPGRRRPTRARA